jgi:hypothetical protein
MSLRLAWRHRKDIPRLLAVVEAAEDVARFESGGGRKRIFRLRRALSELRGERAGEGTT